MTGADDVPSRLRTVARLRRRILLASVVHLCVCLLWMVVTEPQAAWPWFGGAVGAAAYFATLVWRRVEDNELQVTGELLPVFGWGTRITVLRIACLSLLSGYLVSPPLAAQLWSVTGLYGVIAVGDWFDGFLARRTRQETRLGELLDLRVDSLGMLVASVIAIDSGRLPVWYLVLGGAYFVFRSGIFVRRALGRPCYEDRLRPSLHVRAYAGYQMALIAMALIPIFDVAVVWAVATVLMAPSVVAFVRDWGVVVGWFVPGSTSYRRVVDGVLIWTRGVAPLLVRPVFVLASAWMRPSGEPLIVLWGVCACAVGVGAAPRVAAAVILVVLALLPMGTSGEFVLVVTGSVIMLFGGGYLSLYQPEDHWFFRRHGVGARETRT